ncbi:Immunoglobulin (CD79A) binding protein 1 [Dermatophagoides farinae]|uniref:Immunoglobulin (CD79A) binding protein 1 n=2 Tax=Dermatophagoides farinae TaxID=6954 RepID=A0A922I896_DERFA|nr:Immunoglobulin (CD79A) binding protein 1 [Dermatophagoides farinae]
MSSIRQDENELHESLASSFQKILDINEELNHSSMSTNDPKYQAMADAIERLEKMTKNINTLAIFSANETMDEIQTEHLKYLLLPALLADFTLKNQRYDRVQVLETGQIYYRDYIQRLNDYQFCDVNLNTNNDEDESKTKSVASSTNQVDLLLRQAQARESKIQRYRQMKQLESELEQLKQLIIDQQHSGDEDVERQFYLKLIRRWLQQAIDELSAIEAEMPMVKMRAAMLKMSTVTSDDTDKLDRRRQPSSKPLTPIILTKNRLQKQVYGAGYPSMATYSVDEFVQQKIKEGSLQLTDKNIYNNSLYDWANNPEKKKMEEQTEEESKELLIEQDDERELARLRKWDDWKDDHKRGEGNRQNMG